jgi:hypothetical protein
MMERQVLVVIVADRSACEEGRPKSKKIAQIKTSTPFNIPKTRRNDRTYLAGGNWGSFRGQISKLGYIKDSF